MGIDETRNDRGAVAIDNGFRAIAFQLVLVSDAIDEAEQSLRGEPEPPPESDEPAEEEEKEEKEAAPSFTPPREKKRERDAVDDVAPLPGVLPRG